MRTPFSLTPISPILHDIIEGNLAFAKSLNHIQTRLCRLISLPRLPKPHRPDRHHRRPPRQLSIPADHIIDFGTAEKIIINPIPHFRPKRRRSRLIRRRLPRQINRRSPLPRPIHAQRISLPFFQPNFRLILPRQPRLPPMVRHHLPVNPDINLPIRKRLKLIIPRPRRENAPLPPHAPLRSSPRPQRRIRPRLNRILPIFSLNMNPRFQSPCDQLVKRGITKIRSRQSPAIPLRIEETFCRHRLKPAQIPKPREGGIIPQNPISAIRNQKRNNNSPVVLPKIKIVPLDIRHPELILAQPIE